MSRRGSKIITPPNEVQPEPTTNGKTSLSNGDAPPQSESSPGKIWQSFAQVDSSSFADDGERIQALMATYAMLGRLETPWETIVRMCMGEPAITAVLKTFKDLQLFEIWHAHGDEAMTSEQLAKLVSCDPVLLDRMLQHLVSHHMLLKPSPELFMPTKFTLSLLQPVFGEWIKYQYDIIDPMFQKVPEYFEKTKYKNPSDARNGVFQYTKNVEGDLFEYFAANKEDGERFNNIMGGVMMHQTTWLDIFPTKTLIESANDGPLLVDVGGNVGHDMERFRQEYPDLATRMYLQDKHEVVKLSKCPDPLNKMSYDFFTPQPVQGARAYYFHGVLHDWPDHDAQRILQSTKQGMKQGYSTLLIHDNVLSEKNPHPHATSYDLTMMVHVAGLERSETQWRALLKSSGFKVVKIWTHPSSVQSIIEAEIEN